MLIGRPGLTSTSTDTARWMLGQTYEEVVMPSGHTNCYKWVKTRSALSKGFVVWFDSASARGFVVSPTVARTVGLGSGQRRGMIAMGSAAAGAFCWVQVSGVNHHVKTDGSVVKGEQLVFDSNKIADTMAAGEEYASFGQAMLTDSGSICTLVQLYGAGR